MLAPNFFSDVMLLANGGQFWLVTLSATSQPFAIADMDIVLLEQILTCDTPHQAVEHFINSEHVVASRVQVPKAAVENRISTLLSVINRQHAAHTPSLTGISPLAITDVAQASTFTAPLKLSNHHGIFLTQGGFVTWSPRGEHWLSITAKEILTLFRFVEPTTRPTDVAATVSALKAHGLLVEAATANSAVASDNGATTTDNSEGSNEGSNEGNVTSAHTQQVAPFKASTANRWQDIPADGRTPVYFVPHMENHLPLALGVLASALSAYNEGELLQRFVLLPITYLEPNDLLFGPYKKFGPGVWLFSNYMWSIDLNMQISDAVKRHDSRNITIHGGPSTPDYQVACESFMAEHASVDIAAHGEGEVTITEIFSAFTSGQSGTPNGVQIDDFAMSKVAGITYRNQLDGQLIRTAPRARMQDPDAIPSPYLHGFFDQYNGRVEAAIIESNRGCPYGCTFCDWGSATNQKVRKYDLERVFDEIEWIAKHQIRVLWIADANFGLFDRDIEITKHIVAMKQQYGAPSELVVNYTKNSTWRLVEIIKLLNAGGIISQGIISIQTTDEQTLNVINRKNIRTSRYDELAEVFAQEGLPLSTDLMIGLPGATVGSFCADLQRYIDKDVSVKAYPTQLLPNSPMADPDYVSKYAIEVDSNDFLVSTYSYSKADLHFMKAIYEAYVMADGYGLLRYILRYLQWDRGIPAMQFIRDLVKFVQRQPARYAMITWALTQFNKEKCMPGGWPEFYAQVLHYLEHECNTVINEALLEVVKVNQFCMPNDALVYPLTLQLKYDFCAYFTAQRAQQSSPSEGTSLQLEDFAPATLTISDPNGLAKRDLDSMQYDSHQFFWELSCPISRPKSTSDFANSSVTASAVEV